MNKPLQPPDEALGFVITALNLMATTSGNGIMIKYADGKPMPRDQQMAILNRIRDSFLAALVGPLK